MRKIMSSIVVLACLILAFRLLNWMDAYHIALGVPVFILFSLIMRWWQKRTVALCFANPDFPTQNLHEELEEETPEEPESVGRLVFTGVAKAIVVFVFLLICFWLSSKTPVYRLFYDANWEEFSTKLHTLEEARAWPQIIKAVEERLSKPLSGDKQAELAVHEYRASIEWGRSIDNMRDRLERFQAALSTARQYGLDSQIVEAEIRAVEAGMLAEKLMQAPQELPLSARGAITQIDTSIFPPSIVAYISIQDKEGEAIDYLEPRDFRVIHDGETVSSLTIANLSQDHESHIALAMDISGSIKEGLDNGKKAAEHFVNLLSSQDCVELVSFNHKTVRISGWTKDKNALCSAIQSLEAHGDTSIYDALWMTTGDLEQKQGHKAIVLFTDGSDTSSENGLEETLDRVKEQGIPIYIIGLESKDLDRTTLERIAYETGGTYLEAASSSELNGLYDKIRSKIKNQYRFVLEPDGDLGSPSARKRKRGEEDDEEHKLIVFAGRDSAIRMERAYRF